jgi:hypothetical protein
MVPFLPGEHVESATENEVAHAVEAKPKEHVSHVRYMSRSDVLVDTAF